MGASKVLLKHRPIQTNYKNYYVPEQVFKDIYC